MSFRGQASWAKMTSPGGKVKAQLCHLTKRVNKDHDLSYLFTEIITHFSKTIIFIGNNIRFEETSFCSLIKSRTSFVIYLAKIISARKNFLSMSHA
jgi:hypothetical protein